MLLDNLKGAIVFAIVGIIIGLLVTYIAMEIKDKGSSKGYPYWTHIGIIFFITFVSTKLLIDATPLSRYT